MCNVQRFKHGEYQHGNNNSQEQQIQQQQRQQDNINCVLESCELTTDSGLMVDHVK